MSLIKYFISDVDGCLNDGKIYWDSSGNKMFKAFSGYDHDGIKLLRNHVDLIFITADKHGWDITKSRIADHMGCELVYVKESERYEFVKNYGFDNIAFMGDGIYDAKVLKSSLLGIAPSQARVEAIRNANYVTPSKGGEGAYLDAALYILNYMEIDYEI